MVNAINTDISLVNAINTDISLVINTDISFSGLLQRQSDEQRGLQPGGGLQVHHTFTSHICRSDRITTRASGRVSQEVKIDTSSISNFSEINKALNNTSSLQCPHGWQAPGTATAAAARSDHRPAGSAATAADDAATTTATTAGGLR